MTAKVTKYLTNQKERRVFLDALLSGARIEPFATISECLHKQLELERQVKQAIMDLVEK